MVTCILQNGYKRVPPSLPKPFGLRCPIGEGEFLFLMTRIFCLHTNQKEQNQLIFLTDIEKFKQLQVINYKHLSEHFWSPRGIHTLFVVTGHWQLKITNSAQIKIYHVTQTFRLLEISFLNLCHTQNGSCTVRFLLWFKFYSETNCYHV